MALPLPFIIPSLSRNRLTLYDRTAAAFVFAFNLMLIFKLLFYLFLFILLFLLLLFLLLFFPLPLCFFLIAVSSAAARMRAAALLLSHLSKSIYLLTENILTIKISFVCWFL